jgi:hypothetical protein
MRIRLRILAWPLALAAFILNPSFACTGVDDESMAADMRAAVEGTWSISIQSATGTETFSVRLEQASEAVASGSPSSSRWVRAAAACGNRTLLKEAAACAEVVLMPLSGEVLDGAPTLRTAKVGGRIMTGNGPFTTGDLRLEIGALKLFGRIDAAGQVSQLSDGTNAATMSRLTP